LKTLFELAFVPEALKEWHRLDKAVQRQFQRKLEKLQVEPRVPAMKLRQHPDCYRIKARKAGYRAIYHVSDLRITITVIRVARRDKDEAYDKLRERLTVLDLP
jgi:mRNA interferase RelE/StbE